MMTLSQAAAVIGARAVGDAVFESVGTDSRNLPRRALFVALRGENFDGHDFVNSAASEGAAAAMVDSAWAANSPACPIPLLVVADTRIGLGALAAQWRSRFSLPLIGVTGSNGKTTVKEMCAAIMRAQHRLDGMTEDAVLATSGNFNNDIGMPLTLLGLKAGHRAAVIEMGMNQPGEIAYLTGLASPTVAVVNNAQRAHLQGMGSLAEIAREKGSIYEGLSADGVAIINADDPHADYWRQLNVNRKVLTFGLAAPADVSGKCTFHRLGARISVTTPAGGFELELHVPGEHNARNALAATAACIAAGASSEAVITGLRSFVGAKGRLQYGPGLNGSTLVDDSYNANPDSVRAAIDVLASTPGRKILVLGDMGEIGRSSAQLHDEIGGYAKSKGVDALFALGDMSAVAARNFGDGGHHFRTVDALLKAVRPQLDENTVVLVKGSRFMRMERVVTALSAVHNDAPSNTGGSHAS